MSLADDLYGKPKPTGLAADLYGSAPSRPTPSLGHPLAGMDDAQIAQTLGLDYDAIKGSQFYKPGDLGKHVTTSTLGQKFAHSPVGAAVHGFGEIASEGVKWIGKGAHAVGAWSDNDLAYADALKRLREVDYAAASGGEGLGQKVARVVAPLTLPVGEGARALIPAAGKVAAVGRGLLEGGAFAAMQPSGTASLPQKARQIAVGASFGGAVAPIAAAADKAAVALSQRSANRLASNLLASDLADAAAKRGVPMTAGEAGMTMGSLRPQELQRGDVALEKVPGVGLQGFREQQQRGVRQMVESAASAQRAPLAGENWGRVGTASAQRKAQAVKATVRKLYGAVRDAADNAGVMIDPTATRSALADITDAEAQRVLGSAENPALRTALKDIASGTQETTTAPTLLGANGQPVSGGIVTTPKPLTFRQAQQLDDDLGRIIDAQYQGGQNATIGKPGAAQLQQIRQALRADMDAAAQNSGRGDLFDAWKKADRFYKQQAVPLKATVLRGVLKPADGTDPTAAFQTFVRNASKGDAQFLYDRLDPAGRAAVRSGLIDDALGEAMKQRPGGALPGQTGDFLSPAQFVNALEKRREALGVFFKGREAQEWAGIENILRHVPRAGQFLENPPTGARLADPMTLLLSGAGGLAASGGTAAMLGHPGVALAEAGAGAAGLGAAAILRELTTTPGGRRVLLQASRMRPGSRALQALLERAAKSGVGTAALTAGSTQR